MKNNHLFIRPLIYFVVVFTISLLLRFINKNLEDLNSLLILDTIQTALNSSFTLAVMFYFIDTRKTMAKPAFNKLRIKFLYSAFVFCAVTTLVIEALKKQIQTLPVNWVQLVLMSLGWATIFTSLVAVILFFLKPRKTDSEQKNFNA